MSTVSINRGGVPARPREFYLDAGREYVRRYGADELTAAAFNTASAKRNGRPDLRERYLAGRDDGTAWPSLNSIKKQFGGFVAFREELGLPPNKTGGTSRRKAGMAEPDFSLEPRPPAPDPQIIWLRSQLAKAERRALRLGEQLDAAKVRVVEVPVVDERLVTALRQRLADEQSRRKDVKRQLANAVRREARARARIVVADDPAGREVDRLTDRLAESEARVRELEGREPSTKIVVQDAKPVVRTRTVTRKVEIVDTKAVARAERAETRNRELSDALSAALTARDDLAGRLGTLRREAVVEALATERVRAAERRVAEVERKLAAQAELLIGERRQLTSGEVARLRTAGPAGRAVFTAAVKGVVRANAEGTGADLRDALREVMSAAQNWSDRT